MTDATAHGPPHPHEHDHAHGHVHAEPSAEPGARLAHAITRGAPGASSIEASAGGRLVSILLVLAALWAGVYWALH